MPTRLPSFTNSSSAKSTQASRWRRTMVAFSAVVVLAACSSSHVVRYKISFTVEVDGEDRTGSSVIETTFYGGGGANSPYRYYTSTRGVASVIDLGRHGWLVAMKDYSSVTHDSSCKAVVVVGLLDAFKLDVKDLVKLRSGKRELGGNLLPQFVWFPRDQPYKNAEPVCPNRFGRVIGTNIELKAAKIEIVQSTSVKMMLDIKTQWLDEMRQDQPSGVYDGKHGIFKPQLSHIEHSGGAR
ncbi:MAG: hypothetical protein HOO99_14810 [Hyphomicrobiaceae bacterium]|nr:hypothetical protein [Hyphomicrobiaceae bacterium]